MEAKDIEHRLKYLFLAYVNACGNEALNQFRNFVKSAEFGEELVTINSQEHKRKFVKSKNLRANIPNKLAKNIGITEFN